jgi:phenylpropionate dioxygenase-like ring-hydroxylating dioxygenase large terminal subunit
MLKKEQNELITRTGPGTPMGDVLRRYWVPAVLSREVPEPDCPPAKVKLLGENLIAFRDTKGRVGIVDERCPHRTASLWLGRNEASGIRCVFHGWKFDADGNCLDMPNEPPHLQFKDKVHLRAYPTVEMGDIVWAYMGPPEKMPPPPKFDMTQVPASHRNVTKTWQECNWLQGLEGGVDTSHVGLLHFGLAEKEYGDFSKDDPTGFWRRSQSPTIELDFTDYGYRYAGIRPLGEQGNYVRGYHFVMPWTQIRPHQAKTKVSPSGERLPVWKTTLSGHFWVPMDDENCMVWNWHYSFGDEPLEDEERYNEAAGPENVDESNNFRKRRNKDNNWMIDREMQRTKSFTGIRGVNTQDHAVQESMGPIMDRSIENLGPADRAVVVARKLLLDAIDAVGKGADPLGTGESYYPLRAMEKLIPPGQAWRDELLPLMYQTEAAVTR